MFDEDLFLKLCNKYGVEVTEGKGENVLMENDIEQIITPEFLLEVLLQRHNEQIPKKNLVEDKENKVIVVSIQRDNDFTQLLLKGLREFKRRCSGDDDFMNRLQEPETKSLLEDICKLMYIEEKAKQGDNVVIMASLTYIEISIEVENRSVEAYKNVYDDWSNYESVLVYIKDDKVCMEDF